MSQRTEALEVNLQDNAQRVRLLLSEIDTAAEAIGDRVAVESAPGEMWLAVLSLESITRALRAALEFRADLQRRMAAEVARLEQERITGEPVAPDYSQWNTPEQGGTA